MVLQKARVDRIHRGDAQARGSYGDSKSLRGVGRRVQLYI